ncbi:MAG: TrkH family potassium uptake protein, partial [Clostridia bacterium]|nr:TrkH family potassium uptake protein [Clostridia bacterium]
MNRRMICYTLGRIVQVMAFLLFLPALVAVLYRESCVWDFLITIVLALGCGSVLALLSKPRDHVIYAKEGFIIVSLAWVAMSALGALPFVLSGEIPSFVNAFFETVSGFTTTGASILDNVEEMSHGLLFWRSFTHWIGGMGVLVFVMAILPNISDRSIHIMRAEMPGPIVGKLVPRAKDTAKILYLIYIVMTAVQVVLLLCGGMSLFDSLIHTFGTAGTGGFGVKSTSIGGYSPYLQWVITIFMLLFGINFNLYYLVLIRRFRSA